MEGVDDRVAGASVRELKTSTIISGRPTMPCMMASPSS